MAAAEQHWPRAGSSSGQDATALINGGQPLLLLAIAKYNFEGRNNDELSFRKNDVITVSQQLEGGWWEGSLDGRVGWFPADFVGLVAADKGAGQARRTATGGGGQPLANGGEPATSGRLEASRNAAYRGELVSALLDRQREHLRRLERVLDTLSHQQQQNGDGGHRDASPHSSQLLSLATEKLTQLVAFNRTLARRLEEQSRKSTQTQHVGKLFLDVAAELRAILGPFCAKHPDIVEVLSRRKGSQPSSPDPRDLVRGLSLAFRHLDRYATALQEIERHTPEAHHDRGNLHRASLVYRELHNECDLARRQREAQLDLLGDGVLVQCFGPAELERSRDQLLYVGKVSVPVSASEEEGLELDRCIAIWPSTILLLEMKSGASQTTSYTLKERLGTADLMARQQGESKQSVQLCRGSKVLMIVRSVGREDFGQLLNALTACLGRVDNDGGEERAAQRQRKGQAGGPSQTETDDDRSSAPVAANINSISTTSGGRLRVDHLLEMVLPDGEDFADGKDRRRASSSSTTAACVQSKQFSGWVLRPYPPQRGQWLTGQQSQGTATIKMRKGLTPEEQEDALLLRIVEGYCVSGTAGAGPAGSANVVCCAAHAQQRHHFHQQQQRNSADSCNGPCGGGPVRRAASYPDRPQLIVAEEEKLFVEEMDGDQLVIKERSLVDTIYLLKDQLAELKKEMSTMAKTLEQEQRSRRRMEELLRQNNVLLKDNNTSSLAQPTETTAASKQTNKIDDNILF